MPAVTLMLSPGILSRSRVRASRVRSRFDIHDRVNYSVTESVLQINKEEQTIELKLTVDTQVSSVMEYFEIFMKRMLLCCQAAKRLGFTFRLRINDQVLA